VKIKQVLIPALFLLILPVIHAQQRPAANPRLEPDPKALEYNNLGGQTANFSWTALAEISLWASGDTSLTNLPKLIETVTNLNNSVDLPHLGRERAEFILEYMHANILRSYSLYQTRVDTIFTNGRFNCVSSAVLYMILCKSAGINTSGVMTRAHAFVIVHIDGQNIDVETTNRFGFDPGNRREFHDQFGRLTGFSYVPAQNYRDRQTISQIELVSLIFNNRIADHERANRYADAVPLAIDRTVLLFGNSFTDGTSQSMDTIFENPRKELMDRLINYSTTFLRSNREEEGLVWAASASARYPDSIRWQEFFMAAINNRITRFVRERKTTEAQTFLENNRLFLSNENYASLDTIVTEARLLAAANNIRTAQDGDTVINDIRQARQENRITERRAEELTVFSIQKTAAALCAAPGRDWREAINYIERYISYITDKRELEQALRTYSGNIAADYHNRFAAEWNRRNYEEAQRILEEGLAEFPDNRQLLNNREIVNRHNAR